MLHIHFQRADNPIADDIVNKPSSKKPPLQARQDYPGLMQPGANPDEDEKEKDKPEIMTGTVVSPVKSDHIQLKPVPAVVSQDPLRWNLSLSPEFEVGAEVEPAAVIYGWIRKYIGCQVRDIYESHVNVPSVKIGGFLSGLRVTEKQFECEQTRNFTWDGREAPLTYETIQLKSDFQDSFLIEGMEFLKSGDGKIIIHRQPTWGGMRFSFYTDFAHRQLTDRVVEQTKRWAAENEFLRKEAFALSGDFIKRTSEEWDDVFLEEENKTALRRTMSLLNEQQEKFACRGSILLGPPGCLHADTPIFDPVSGTTETVYDRYKAGAPFHVLARDNNDNIVVAKAERPWQYQPAEMLKFTFSDGRTITVTTGHRFWTGSSYDTAASVAERLQASGRVLLESIAAPCQLVQTSNDQHCMGTAEDFPNGCFLDRHPCDAQPRRSLKNAQSTFPLTGGVLQRSHEWSHPDGLEHKCTNIGRTWFCHQPSLDCDGQTAFRFVATMEYQQSRKLCEQAVCLSSFCAPSLPQIAQSNSNSQSPETSQGLLASCCATSNSLRWSNQYKRVVQVVQVEKVGKHQYYDFHVPGYENYWACGVFHHNTGKTLSARILRNQADATFIWISARDFGMLGSFDCLQMGFQMARELAPTVLCMEDVDNWLSDHSIDLMKTEMDGVARQSGVWTILTTNYPEQLPDALIDRPGRFHDVLRFANPTAEVRKQMFGRWLPDYAPEMIESSASATDGYSGAHVYELASFVRALHEHDGMEKDAAVSEALAKIKDQRQLIDEIQLLGSHYNRRERSTPKVWYPHGRTITFRGVTAVKK